MSRNSVALDEALAKWRALDEEQRSDARYFMSEGLGPRNPRSKSDMRAKAGVDVAANLLRAAAEPEAKACPHINNRHIGADLFCTDCGAKR